MRAMTTWNPRANDLFLEALALGSPGERRAFLDAACSCDPALRERVEALLRSHEQAGGFLERPAPELLAERLAVGEALEFLEPSDRPGVLGRLGHYEILEVIGRGGMGIVLRASDEQLKRVVAI